MAPATLLDRLRRAVAAARGGRPARGPLEPTSGDLRGAPSRRLVLRAAALAPLVAAGACGDDLPGPEARVAVIGAGLAGLTCAYALARAGLRPTVFDAAGRVGGRALTARDQLAGGQRCELGGEFVGSGHRALARLCDEFGLALDPLPADDERLHVDGAEVELAALAAALAPVTARMAAALVACDARAEEFARVDHLSIPRWLAEEAGLPADDLRRRVLELACTEAFGLPAEEQSALNLLTHLAAGPPAPWRAAGAADDRYRLRDGSDALPAALARALGAGVRLEHGLAAVEAQGGGYLLRFATPGGGVELEVDRVVYALPFTRLRAVALARSGLSAAKREVIADLGYGTGARLVLQFSGRPWAAGAALAATGDLQALWDASRGQPGAPGLLAWQVGGRRGVAVGEGSAEAQARGALPSIDQVFPGTGGAYLAGSALRQHWPSAPHHLGSRACYRVGQWRFLGLEGRREGGQHFCGEHCSEDHQGSMEGAAETGAMVALEILEALGRPAPPLLGELLAGKLDRPRGSYRAGGGRRMPLRALRRG